MMDKTKRRDSAPFHVTCAKNYAAMAESAGLKHMDLLESYARKHGSKDWNTFCATGEITLSLRGASANAVPVRDNHSTAQGTIFREAMLLMVEAAFREGMSGWRTGPIILTDERGLAYYHDLAHAGRIVLSKKPGPGRMRVYRNLDAWTILKAAEDILSDFQGLVIIDALHASSEEFHEAVRRIAPKAFSLLPVVWQDSRQDRPTIYSLRGKPGEMFSKVFEKRDFVEHPLQPPHSSKLEDGMWSNRYRLALEAFADSNMDLDPEHLPGINDLDGSDPALARLLKTVPGYQSHIDIQNAKAAEQFDFMLSPLRH